MTFPDTTNPYTSKPHPKKQEVIALLLEGKLTSGQIAEKLGITRNVVCGIRCRAGGAGVFGAEVKKRRREEVAGGMPQVRGGGKQLEALGIRDCKYPYGEPGAPDFAFCARPREGDGPYCRHHRMVCTHVARSTEAAA